MKNQIFLWHDALAHLQSAYMSETVYISTSILGHLTARPTTNPILVGNIQIRREWWQFRRSSFELYTSQAVINEVGRGDPEIATQRLELLQGIPLVRLVPCESCGVSQI